jgi:NADPH-dependent 2,4-dienoyl-CoA reductase/sulfur reductase-like enzyme
LIPTIREGEVTKLDRRSFLERLGQGALGIGVWGERGAWRRKSPSEVPEVAVIGAGAFGGWTALYLREMGFSVTLIDAYGPGNARSSSGGETRQLRAAYGDRELYSRWAMKARERWKTREAEAAGSSSKPARSRSTPIGSR